MKKLGKHKLYRGDCLKILRKLEDNSVDSIVTDPPYGISFMGKKWDYDVPSVEIWKECLRVLKPGGHLLAFAGTRTQHRMACRIEDAGFEIREMLCWVYGSGFPKSQNIGKMIDKTAGRIGHSTVELKKHLIVLLKESGKTRSAVDAECGFRASNYTTLPKEGKRPDPWVNCLPTASKWKVMKRVLHAGDDLDSIFASACREVIGTKRVAPGVAFSSKGPTTLDVTAPATVEAKRWEGWGTALKPALEPITLARKPFKGTVAANVLKHGTGALNIDGCRIASADTVTNHARGSESAKSKGKYGDSKAQETHQTVGQQAGRWPANLIHDGSEEVTSRFPTSTSGAMSSKSKRAAQDKPGSVCYGTLGGTISSTDVKASSGSAARFFYQAKANKKDRDENNKHPTVKPTDLMRYLVRLVTPKKAICLDPFMGSGSTGKACVLEGVRFIGMERDKDSFKTSVYRIRKIRKTQKSACKKLPMLKAKSKRKTKSKKTK